MSKYLPSRLLPALHVSTLQRKISLLFVFFGLVLAIGLSIQGNLSQRLIVHPIWQEILRSSTAQYLADARPAGAKQLPATGLIRGWHVRGEAVPADMPGYFARLKPGYYDEEQTDAYDTERSYAVLVTPTGANQRIIMSVDITDLENYQNMTALLSAGIAIVSGLMIAGSILWLYCSLRRPIQSLAQRMDELDPEQPAQRLATDFDLRELHDIAMLVNRHLERVERFIERERSLLDQASHEFRTPIAVIAGAVDVLKLYDLPAAAESPLERIQSSADNLTEIMSALLFLSREPDDHAPCETTALDVLVASLIEDHEHLLDGKSASFVVEQLEPLTLDSPEAVVRIVVGNMLRNAAENSYQGAIRVRLADGCLSIQDSGNGFDTVAAAQRYTKALRDSTKQGGGQGLGLFLTRRVCERFGWTLKISSNAAQGTLAKIYFGKVSEAG